MVSTRPHLRKVSSEDVEGAAVCDDVGKKIGKIDHLVIETATGKVLYAVVNVMGSWARTVTAKFLGRRFPMTRQ